MHNENDILPDTVPKSYRDALKEISANYLHPVREVEVGESVIPARTDYPKAHGGKPVWYVGSVVMSGPRAVMVDEIRDESDSPLVDEIVVKEPSFERTGSAEGGRIGRCPYCGQLVQFPGNCWRCDDSRHLNDDVAEPSIVPRRSIIDDAARDAFDGRSSRDGVDG